MADRIGVERRTIQCYENAVTDPRYADLLLIARALEVPLAELAADGRPPPTGA
ncbi:helix-turn-helix transcriptional regulator [Streptomyces sp. NPDC020898]|uniref:helix-turn-helix transcriptional regulator n=1 Tax=Streptomyces sp. NPDC020898 TaxID=3365101 RepID=UPI00378CF6C7